MLVCPCCHTQLCRVQLVVSNGVQQHTLVTSLTPDGSRSYKLDGKLRTGSQVKVWAGPHLDRFAVLQGCELPAGPPQLCSTCADL
jgi:hypothetical protein